MLKRERARSGRQGQLDTDLSFPDLSRDVSHRCAGRAVLCPRETVQTYTCRLPRAHPPEGGTWRKERDHLEDAFGNDRTEALAGPDDASRLERRSFGEDTRHRGADDTLLHVVGDALRSRQGLVSSGLDGG